MTPDHFRIENIRPEHAQPLAQLQRVCFPTLAAAELMRAGHFLSHCRLFPQGNFVALAGMRVVGLGSGFLIDFDFDQPQHNFQEIIADGFYSQHDPDGDWYYGGDISVHPDFRRRGIGTQLYRARMGIVKALNRKGIVAGGLIPGYAAHKGRMDARQYVERVLTGELIDSTLTFQLHRGFQVRGLLRDYIQDDASDNWATLIVWDNPDYQPD